MAATSFAQRYGFALVVCAVAVGPWAWQFFVWLRKPPLTPQEKLVRGRMLQDSGCLGLLGGLLGLIFLLAGLVGGLYGLVRFIKWAWAD